MSDTSTAMFDLPPLAFGTPGASVLILSGGLGNQEARFRTNLVSSRELRHSDWHHVQGTGIGSVASIVLDDQLASAATPPALSVNWTRLTRARLSPAAYAKIFRIASRKQGWRGPGSCSLSSGALTTFLEFWSVVRTRACEPQLALVPNGNLGAEWFKSGRRRLDLEFCDDGSVYFGIQNGRGILEGKELVKNVAAILFGLDSKPLNWTAK